MLRKRLHSCSKFVVQFGQYGVPELRKRVPTLAKSKSHIRGIVLDFLIGLRSKYDFEDSTAPYVFNCVAGATYVNEIWVFVGRMKSAGDYSLGLPDKIRIDSLLVRRREGKLKLR